MEPTTIEPQPALSPTAIQVMTPGPVPPTPNHATARKPRPLPLRLLDLVSSLRVTVVLFLLSMVLVFYGTWAQKEMSNFAVVDKYFRSALVWVPFKVLTFFTLDDKAAANNWVVPFPGGWTLGTLLLINLLAAHALRFKLSWKKTGVIVLHLGIILMMAGEVITGVFAHEGMLVVSEHETVNYLQRSGELELAFTDVTNPDRKQDDIVTVYDTALARGGKISDKDLPFDLNVVRFFRNSELDRWKEGDPPPLADADGDNEINVVELPPVDGIQPGKEERHVHRGRGTQGQGDRPIAQDAHLFDAAEGQDDRTRRQDVRDLSPPSPRLSALLRQAEQGGREEATEHGDGEGLLELGPAHRSGAKGRPRGPHLHEHAAPLRRRDVFPGEHGPGRENGTPLDGPASGPQSGMDSSLSVLLVRCGRHDDPLRHPPGRLRVAEGYVMNSKIFFPAFVVCAAALYLTVVFLPPVDASDAMQLREFASLPVQESGRIMPFDTFARVRLLVLGHKASLSDVEHDKDGKTILDKDGKVVEGNSMSQVVWALDTIVHKKAADDRRFIRIDNEQLLKWLGLDPNRHTLRFSLREFASNPKLLDEAKRIHEGGLNKNDLMDVKIADLNDKFGTVMRMVGLDDPHIIPPSAKARGGQSIRDVPWLSFRAAMKEDAMLENPTADQKALALVRNILAAYRAGNVVGFNQEVGAYREYLNTLDPTLLTPTAVETLTNHFAPFYQCAILFGFVFLFGCISWMTWSEPLANAAMSLGVFTVVVYTIALGTRIWISGYAPVTNLYSSAIFIGWGAAILCLGLEGFLRNGIGSVLAAVTAFLALIVAMNLVDGDTMGKLVAVLESNFWLSTHVTCVTFGYMATFVAGFLGIAYVLLGVLTDKLRGETGVLLVKVTYGVVCFATLLSFVGTVLGGIWADQSWGRFWGWDPKENGALLIVVWNAIILHARWGGIVKSRGVALLAIGGNIVTSWSWFGVNLLGIGLHNYGFMQGVMTTLIVWAILNLGVIAIGLIPQRQWASFMPQTPQEPRQPNDVHDPAPTRLKPA